MKDTCFNCLFHLPSDYVFNLKAQKQDYGMLLNVDNILKLFQLITADMFIVLFISIIMGLICINKFAEFKRKTKNKEYEC